MEIILKKVEGRLGEGWGGGAGERKGNRLKTGGVINWEGPQAKGILN